MAGPNDLQLKHIQYFTDLAIQYGDFSNTFLNFHIVVAAAALGWALSSRNWKTGLPPITCVVFAVGYLVFSLAILYCIGILYDRMNAAIRVAAALWAETPIQHDMGSALTEVGAEHWPNRAMAGYVLGNFFSEGRFYVFLIDAGAALVGAMLLSALGRKQQA